MKNSEYEEWKCNNNKNNVILKTFPYYDNQKNIPILVQ